MYTLLFCAQQPAASDVTATLRAALDAVTNVVPKLGSPAQLEVRALPSVNGALGILRPERDLEPSLIQTDQSDALEVITFGTLTGTKSVASAVLTAYANSGAAAIERLDGNLSALIVEKASMRVLLLSTLLGQRTLRYAQTSTALWVSPHDIPLLAAGTVPLELDLASMASIAACDWSLLGKPILKAVSCAHPLFRLSWQDGALTSTSSAALDLQQRIDVRDQRAIAGQLEIMAAALEGTARDFVQGKENVTSALTAGMDSRLVWALLVGALTPGQRLSAITSGAEQSLDVRIAKKLAALCKTPHRRTGVEALVSEDFAVTSRLFAYFMNGDSNAKRALARAPTVGPGRAQQAGGMGGEIFRGFFYPYFGPLGAVPNDLDAIESTLLRWRFRRFAQIPFASPELTQDVRSRLREALQCCATASSNGFDVVDQFYLFERYARWGSTRARLPWSNTWTPFECTPAIQAAYRLPAPIGRVSGLHPLLIRRHLPKSAYFIPINAGQFLFLEGPGRVRYAARQALNVRAFVGNKLSRKLFKSKQTKGDAIADLLNQGLRDTVRGLLCAQDSVSPQLLGREGVDKVLSSHERHANQLELLGYLLSFEQYWRLAQDVVSEARARGVQVSG